MYKDPLGGHPVLLAILPIDTIEPTPFQRDLSDTHHKRLADVIAKTGRYLDPVIAVVAPSQGFWTPNGRHRLAAMRRLGARSPRLTRSYTDLGSSRQRASCCKYWKRRP
jgi:ParB family transcriptional regulator, chromosome partitioning protein